MTPNPGQRRREGAPSFPQPSTPRGYLWWGGGRRPPTHNARTRKFPLREKSAFLRLPPAVAEGGSPGALGWGCRSLTVALGEKEVWSSPLALPPLPLFPPSDWTRGHQGAFHCLAVQPATPLIPPGHWTRPVPVAVRGLAGGPLVSWHRIKRWTDSLSADWPEEWGLREIYSALSTSQPLLSRGFAAEISLDFWVCLLDEDVCFNKTNSGNFAMNRNRKSFGALLLN